MAGGILLGDCTSIATCLRLVLSCLALLCLNLRGHVVAVSRNRDYRVKMSSGCKLWRNRRFIKLDHTSPKHPAPDPANDPAASTPKTPRP